MCTLSKEQSILSTETIHFFFFRIMPLIQLDFLSSIPQRALAPACDALVHISDTFSSFPRTNFCSSVTMILSSANASDLD